MYDNIIVGGGSAGCVVAARLSEDPSRRVLLIEAGGDDSHADVRNPLRWPTLLEGDLDWNYRTAPLRSCHNRIDRVPRAKMLGGCHSHNATVWVQGHPQDFDNWSAQGCAGWGWNDASRLYKKIEDWQGPKSEWRGSGGPQYVAPLSDPNPIAEAFVASGAAVDLPRIEDYNAGNMEGTSFFDVTIKEGQRFSVVQAYLQSARTRPNLTILTHAESHRLVLEGTRCVGVEYTHEGLVKTARADAEVIVSGGVFGSPCLLMRSGIGPAPDLKRLGIPVIVDLPGVGQNLQDHPLVGSINYECCGRLPSPRNNGTEATAWWHSRTGLAGPDIHLVLLEFPFATPALVHHLPHRNCYAIAPSVVRVASRGSVKLANANPQSAPIIDVNFLERGADIDAMLTAITLGREMGASDAFTEFRGREVIPGDLSRSEMIEFIRRGVTTYFHPTGTCKMGIDTQSVVDPLLRVRGIAGLRIADASIMPTITTGNTNAPTIMIGEKAAEMIRAG